MVTEREKVIFKFANKLINALADILAETENGILDTSEVEDITMYVVTRYIDKWEQIR